MGVGSALQASVLVLNQNYEPLNVCNVRRAIVLLDRGKAEVVEEHESLLLRTFARVLRVPSVIRMIYFIRRPRPVARLSRREVFARDDYTCQYCGLHTVDLTLDHVVPRHRGGEHSWENLVSACRVCNHRKAGRTPAEARMRLRQPPRRPRVTLAGIFRRYLDHHPGWRVFFPGAPAPRRRENDSPAVAAGG